MEKESLEGVVAKILSGEDKEKMKDPNYKNGFEDCLKIIAEIFGLRE